MFEPFFHGGPGLFAGGEHAAVDGERGGEQDASGQRRGDEEQREDGVDAAAFFSEKRTRLVAEGFADTVAPGGEVEGAAVGVRLDEGIPSGVVLRKSGPDAEAHDRE
jgi:hypothetical protein